MKIAYLHVIDLNSCYNKENDGSYSFLDKEVGQGRGTFDWLDENGINWFVNNQEADVLCFNGKYYKYGKEGYRKATLNELQLINKPVETTNEQPKVSDFEKDLKTFIKVRKHAEGKNPNAEWAYCNGALDTFNFLKSKLG